MELLPVAFTELLLTAAALILPYALLLALANLIYRLVSGRFFRWLSLRTVVPFFLVVGCVWGLFLYALLEGRAFVITH